MGSVEQSIDLDVPVKTAYDQWTQFEDFPKFMKGVKEIRQIDDTHLHWKAEIAGHVKEWDAEITEQHPDERVAWKATDGSPNAGVVTFHRLSDDTSRADGADRARGGRPAREGRQRARRRHAPGEGRSRALQGARRGARRPGGWRGDVDAG